MTSRIVAILLLGAVIRISGVLYMHYSDPTTVLVDDALSFYLNASYIARTGIYYPEMGIGWTHYVNAMGLLMSGLGENALVICGISVLFWFLGAILTDRTLVRLLAPDHGRIMAALIMTLLPTSIYYTSIPLREPMQLFGIAAICYMLVSVVMYRDYLSLVIGLVGAICAGTSHIAMLVASLAALPMLFFYNALIGSKRISFGKIALSAALIFVGVALIFIVIEAKNFDTSGGLVDAAEKFQQAGATSASRAQYKLEIAPSTGVMAIPFLVIGFLQYMFEPMPWRISSAGDIVVFAENILRLGLLIIAVRGFLREARLKKVTIFVFLLMYFLLEGLWSLGTINWGTASRHHLPALPFLLVAACMSHRAFRRALGTKFRAPNLVYS